MVFFDTEGFDEVQSVNDANQSLAKFDSMKKEIHIIYYVMNFANRLMKKKENF